MEKMTQASWQQLACKFLKHYQDVLTCYGVNIGKDLHLEVDKTTIYSYCNLETGRISLNFPGTEQFGDLLLMATVDNLLARPGIAETLRFLRGLLPYLLAHELTHYLRNRYGTFTSNSWLEEHVANQVGITLAWTVTEFTNELPFLRQVAEVAREHLPLPQGQETTFNQSYMTDVRAYMQYQLACFCQQVLAPKPPEPESILQEFILG